VGNPGNTYCRCYSAKNPLLERKCYMKHLVRGQAMSSPLGREHRAPPALHHFLRAYRWGVAVLT